MRLAFRWLALLVVLGLGLLLTPLPGQLAKPPLDPSIYEVHLVDGSVVKMHILSEEVDVATRYGKLKVPVADIRRIEVGLRYPNGVEHKVEKAIERLGDPEFKVREAAQAELLALKEYAYAGLKRSAKSDDQEVKRRIADLTRQIEEKVPAETLRLRDHDVVFTTHFPIAGRIEAQSLKGRSGVFGEVQLQLVELRQVRSLVGGGEVEVTVDAGRFGAPNGDQWMETEVEIDKGSSLKIRASGTINLNPQGGNFQAGPAGNNQWGQNGGPGPAGSLIGKIGRNGQPFLVGTHWEGDAPESGKLYLRITPSPWGVMPSGAYTVKIIPEVGLDAKIKPTTNPDAPRPPVKDKVRFRPGIPAPAPEKKEVPKQ